MSITERFQALREAARSEKRKFRIVAFGSSNTERFITGTHWFDCLDLAI